MIFAKAWLRLSIANALETFGPGGSLRSSPATQTVLKLVLVWLLVTVIYAASVIDELAVAIVLSVYPIPVIISILRNTGFHALWIGLAIVALPYVLCSRVGMGVCFVVVLLFWLFVLWLSTRVPSSKRVSRHVGHILAGAGVVAWFALLIFAILLR